MNNDPVARAILGWSNQPHKEPHLAHGGELNARSISTTILLHLMLKIYSTHSGNCKHQSNIKFSN